MGKNYNFFFNESYNNDIHRKTTNKQTNKQKQNKDGLVWLFDLIA